MSTPSSAAVTSSTLRTVPIGPLVTRIAAVAWRARRALLLIGGPGVGKSELLVQAARLLGIRVTVIDLSLCEPSDLVGLPHRQDGRTRFAPPSSLPTDGEGLLVFEELNRAERFIQGPVLQLLTARRLNDYVLPDGWSCAAAINPDDGNHDVRALDPAMMSRFLVVNVRADRQVWLQWARGSGVHPVVLDIVTSDTASFDQVSPRSWKYVSDLLSTMTKEERQDRELLHELLASALPMAWAVVVGETLQRLRDGDLIAADILRRGATDAALSARLQQLREQGRTDVLRALADDMRELVGSMVELARLCAQQDFTLEKFEHVLSLLPGDMREPLQDALGANRVALRQLDLDFADILANGYAARSPERQLQLWQQDGLLQHRAQLFVSGLCSHLKEEANVLALRRSNSGRRVLGRILTDLRPPLRQRLLDCLASLQVEAILGERGR